VLPDLPSRASPRRGGATVLSGMRGRHSAVIARRDGGCHSEPAAPHLVKAPPLRQRLLSDKFRCEGDRLELAELRHASGERRKRGSATLLRGRNRQDAPFGSHLRSPCSKVLGTGYEGPPLAHQDIARRTRYDKRSTTREAPSTQYVRQASYLRRAVLLRISARYQIQNVAYLHIERPSDTCCRFPNSSTERAGALNLPHTQSQCERQHAYFATNKRTRVQLVRRGYVHGGGEIFA
jgi:hypothetical protein